MKISTAMIDLQFWQGPVDGWVYKFQENKLPHKIQIVAKCANLKEVRYAFYILDIRKKRYEYVGSSRKLSEKVKTRETLLVKPFYYDAKKNTLLQVWVPISSLKKKEDME